MGKKLFGGAPKAPVAPPPPAPLLAPPAPLPQSTDAKPAAAGEVRADQSRKKRAVDPYGSVLGGNSSGKKTLLGE